MAIRENDPEDSGTALVVLGSKEPITLVEFFKPAGSDAVLERMREEVRRQAAALDISTKKGREAIAALAYKVARTKTAVDDMGKDLVEVQKKTIAEVDAERRKFRDACDDLKDEVRKPLTEWENEEKQRIEDHQEAIRAIEKAGRGAAAIEDPEVLNKELEAIAAILTHRNWQEFKTVAGVAFQVAKSEIQAAFDKATQRLAERAELKRLRQEEDKRRQRERDEAIARQAREQAERGAEAARQRQAEAAERERQRIDTERLQAEARARQAEAERMAAEERHQRELQEAETRRIREAELAEQRRLESERAAAHWAQEAAEQAERYREAAVRAENQRHAAEAARIAAETEKREASKRHVNSVNKKIADSFMLNGAPDRTVAEKLVMAIAQGRVPNCTISY